MGPWRHGTDTAEGSHSKAIPGSPHPWTQQFFAYYTCASDAPATKVEIRYKTRLDLRRERKSATVVGILEPISSNGYSL